MPRLLLVRHCQSTGQQPDGALSELGHSQARDLAERLAAHPIDHLVASTYKRAVDTLAPFAARAGLVLHQDERLVERRLSPEPIDEWRDVVRRSFTEPDYCVPGGESGREVCARAWQALDEILGAGHVLPAVASHGQLISLVLHGIDSSFGFDGWQSLANPDVILVERQRSGRLSFERLGPGGG